MILWFWLFFLGWITYRLLQRSVAAQGSTPLWLLWRVLMFPALVWAAWTLIFSEDVSPPLWLVLGPMIFSPLLYWLLMRTGLSPQHRLKLQRKNDRHKRLDSLTAIEDGTDSDPLSTSPEHLQRLREKVTEGLKKEIPRPLNSDEEAALKHCFPWSIFALHQVEYRLQAVICQGQLRTDPSEAYQRIRHNITDRFGDRFVVLFQENWTGKPFFALVPNQQAEAKDSTTTSKSSDRDAPLHRPLVALALLFITLFTTTFVGTIFAGVPLESLVDLADRPHILWQGFPYGLSLVLILGCHELGHFLTARHYKIPTTLPYFIPIPTFLGTFGAFIRIQEPIPHRRALFDISFAGPAAGLVVALPCLIWGLGQSQVVPFAAESSMINFQSLNPHGSVLLAFLSHWVMGERLAADMAISLHPVAIAGYLGIIVTALNLMPVGQLDGGHIVHAMFGQRMGAIIGQVARLCMLLLSIRQPEFLLWSLLLLFIPVVDEPALNDVSELDDWRDALGFVALVFLLLIVLPMPRFLWP